ncbi:hypothetical protein DITRI_Ditri04bG0047900 [Diplodiscus trichospermus]
MGDMPFRCPYLKYTKVLRMETSGGHIVNVREVLGPYAKHIQLMSKVENHAGVINLEKILRETNAFMVARGKPIVTATQMLESRTKSPRPTRAEVTDVSNTVLNGTDCEWSVVRVLLGTLQSLL